jgi:uncharacterized protein (TIGR02611 family)
MHDASGDDSRAVPGPDAQDPHDDPHDDPRVGHSGKGHHRGDTGRGDLAEAPTHEHHSALVEAAIEAEFETGVREPNVEAAERHILFRLGRMAIGFVVLGLGFAAIPLPGPGWLIVGVGLGILAQDFVWAERTLNIVRKRLPQDDDGKIPAKTWVMIAVATLFTMSVSIWWSFFR